MFVPIFILSTIFIAIAFVVNQNNAKYLLSGYNTMSEVERQNFDIKSYMPYFRKFHIFLGVTLLIISLILYYFVNSDWSGIFLGTYPILAYFFFIWKSNQFSKSKKQNLKTYVWMAVMFLLFLAIIYGFKSSLKNNEIIVGTKKIEITGAYGTTINICDLKSVELIDKLPEISTKINGFALETIKKGFFRTVTHEKVKLLINSKKTPVILFITNDNQKIYYASKDKSNQEIYNEVKRKAFN
jgi:signal transduction histidine kinase